MKTAPLETTSHVPAGGLTRPEPRCPSPAAPTRSLSAALRLLILGAILALLALAPGETTTAWLPAPGDTRPGTLLAACVLYALVLALPFVPAMELGLLIMVVFGEWGAVGAWLATVFGLNLAYGLALAWPHTRTLDRQRLPRPLRRLMQQPGRRLSLSLPSAVTLALLLNLPGNTALGGGGGISMLYGAGRILSWPRFAATVAAATAVLPGLMLVGFL